MAKIFNPGSLLMDLNSTIRGDEFKIHLRVPGESLRGNVLFPVLEPRVRFNPYTWNACMQFNRTPEVIDFREEIQNTCKDTQGFQNQDAYVHIFYITFKVIFAVGTSQTKLSVPIVPWNFHFDFTFDGVGISRRTRCVKVSSRLIQRRLVCKGSRSGASLTRVRALEVNLYSSGWARFKSLAHAGHNEQVLYFISRTRGIHVGVKPAQTRTRGQVCGARERRYRDSRALLTGMRIVRSRQRAHVHRVDGPLDKTDLGQGIRRRCGGVNARGGMTVPGSRASRKGR
ncbi:hypothetical protein B0H13DRAFT_1904258 [Mycena leptocephala]|nr:hypothetical protein B0H13DRAFT_1904258 [Mycena leptocephala]